MTCSHCGRTFGDARALSVHACKAHEDCADRTLDRHRSQTDQLHVRLEPDLSRDVKREASKRGVSGAEVARIALRKLVKR